MPCCPFRTCNQQRYFDTDEALFQHARTSRKVHPCCVPCTRVFVDATAYLQHRESVHTFPCAKCGSKYRSESALQQHHQSSKAHAKCNRCGEGFYNRGMLNSHIASEHPAVHCRTCGGLELFQDELESHFRNSFNHPNCPQCHIGFETRESYDEHNLKMHPQIKCQICATHFASVEDLDHHNREPAIHTKCQYCGGMFKDAAAIIEHVTSEHFLEHMKASSATIAAALESSSTALRSESISNSTIAQSITTWSKLPPLSAVRETQRPPFALPAPSIGDPGTPTSVSSLTSPPSVSSGDETIFPTSDSDFGSETDGRDDPEFSFAFHPTFRSAFPRAPPSHGGNVDDISTSSTTLRDASMRLDPPKTVTPSLLTEPMLRLPICPDSSTRRSPDVRDISSPSPLKPSTSRIKVPLAKTPGSSGDLENFDLLKGIANFPDERDLSPQSLSPPETPVAPTRDKTQAGSPPKANITPPRVSFHCRICQLNPCEEITATVCGHIFCNRCIVEEVRRNPRCPVCQAAILLFALLRLDAATA